MCNKTNRAIARAAMVIALAMAVLMSGAETSGGGAGGATVLYVDDDAPPAGDGLTWTTAFQFLQDALYATQPGSGVEEIRIGQGLYKPDQDEAGNVTPGDRAASFQLIASVPLMGGYAGYGAPDPDERDIEFYETILSGDLLGDDPPDEIISDENSYHVVSYINEGDEPATLDGLTITHGLANGEGEGNGGGLSTSGPLMVANCTFRTNEASGFAGAIVSSDWRQLTVENSVFKGNHAHHGGAAFTVGEATYIDCVFEANSSSSSGGAIRFMRLLVLDGCTFDGNTAEGYGGAIDPFAGDVQCTNCTFVGNIAAKMGGALDLGYQFEDGSFIVGCAFTGNSAVAGGGVYWSSDGHSNPISIEDCRFLMNIATERGGALDLNGLALNIRDCIFSGNISSEGGAVRVGYGYEGEQLFENCTFTNNAADHGGAIYSDCSLPKLTSCTFIGNDAEQNGGAMFNHGGEPTLIGCTFAANSAEGGGAIYDEQAAASYLSGCEFTNNTAYGGGAIESLSGDSLSVANCTFEDNDAYAGGAIECASTELFSLDQCAFEHNSAMRGAGLYVSGVDDGSVGDCRFFANSTTDGGGAIHALYYEQLIINACRFEFNRTAADGGAIFNTHGALTIVNSLLNGNAASHGAGLCNSEESQAAMLNCTFSANSATVGGGGVYSDSPGSSLPNCILWGNTPDQIVDAADASTTVSYCDIEGGWAGAGEHNIDVNPRFVNPLAGDFRLRGGSPCIDAGDNTYLPDGITTDLDGNPRFFDDEGVNDTGFGDPSIVDIGAYEVQTSSCPTDVNNDHTTDPADIVALLEAWGPCSDPYDCREDVNFDGKVNIDDLFAILGAWGSCP